VCADLHFGECEEVLWVMLSLSSVSIALQDSSVFRCGKGSSVAWGAFLHLHPVCEDDNKGIISASKPMASSPGKPRKFSIHLRLGFVFQNVQSVRIPFCAVWISRGLISRGEFSDSHSVTLFCGLVMV
jgi:hypothetical protein